MKHDTTEDSPYRQAAQDEWRRGSAPAQKAYILQAREALRYIKDHPGCTRPEMMAAGVRPTVRPLVEHGLVYWTRNGVRGRGVSPHSDARWYVKTP